MFFTTFELFVKVDKTEMLVLCRFWVELKLRCTAACYRYWYYKTPNASIWKLFARLDIDLQCRITSKSAQTACWSKIYWLQVHLPCRDKRIVLTLDVPFDECMSVTSARRWEKKTSDLTAKHLYMCRDSKLQFTHHTTHLNFFLLTARLLLVPRV